MRIYILGIGGTLMGSIASLAQQLGHQVSGADKSEIYPPMSHNLTQQNIPYHTPYNWDHLAAFEPDMVLIGNTMSRGHPIIEQLLLERIPYDSAPHWLATHVFPNRQVIAVSGTHGKTTTTTLIAFLLHRLGHDAGFLIGGVPMNFDTSAYLGSSPYFVIEADEYDTAFFDKRAKFIHWDPAVWIVNNIEFDHADIYANLDAMLFAYHQQMRRLNPDAALVTPAADPGVQQLLKQGCWSKWYPHGPDQALWISSETPDGSKFQVHLKDGTVHKGQWSLLGEHQLQNLGSALMALHVLRPDDPLSLSEALKHLPDFKSVKRRLEVLYQDDGCTLYDDFAHHPTAIFQTLKGLRARIGNDVPLLLALDLNSNSFKMGAHVEHLPGAIQIADQVFGYQNEKLTWDVAKTLHVPTYSSIHALETDLLRQIQTYRDKQQPCHVVCMSNGSFAGLKERMKEKLITACNA